MRNRLSSGSGRLSVTLSGCLHAFQCVTEICDLALGLSDHCQPETDMRRPARAGIGPHNDILCFMKITLHLACLTLLSGAALAPAADAPALRGYSPESAHAEHDWEVMFRAIPSTQNLHDYLQRLSARPHHVGSAYDKDNAEWILGKFKEWGLDAHIETFEVLFPSPKNRTLELIAPEHFTARLAEPTVSGDS